MLRRERKRRLEAARAYREAGREDLADGEEAEAQLIGGYLPAELSDEELRDDRRASGARERRGVGARTWVARWAGDGGGRRARGRRARVRLVKAALGG